MTECCDIDHVIVAVADLDAAAARLRGELGLASIPGGRHPGHGTANRIVPLGGAYLELMAVVDPAEAESSALGRAVLEATRRGDRPFALCLRTPDIAEVAARLGLELLPMTRERPDGTRLAWTLAGLDHALGPEHLPFFIEWHVEPGSHPAETPIEHPGGAACFGRVAVAGDRERILTWLGPADSLLEIVDGEPGLVAVEVVVGGTHHSLG